MMKTYRIVGILFGFWFMMLIPAIGETAWADEHLNVKTETRIGFKGIYQSGTWVPINIILENRGKSIRGILELLVTSGYAFRDNLQRSAYHESLDLPAGSRKLYSFTVYIPSSTHPLTVKIIPSHGKPHSESISLREGVTEKGIVLLADHASTQQSLDGLSADYSLIKLKTGELPQSNHDYNGISAVVLRDRALVELKGEQLGALEEWIRLGGTVFLFGKVYTERIGNRLLSAGAIPVGKGDEIVSQLRDSLIASSRVALVPGLDFGLADPDPDHLQDAMLTEIPERIWKAELVLAFLVFYLVVLYLLKGSLLDRGKSGRRTRLALLSVFLLSFLTVLGAHLKEFKFGHAVTNELTYIRTSDKSGRVIKRSIIGVYSFLGGEERFVLENSGLSPVLFERNLPNPNRNADLVVSIPNDSIRLNLGRWSYLGLRMESPEELPIEIRVKEDQKGLRLVIINGSQGTLSETLFYWNEHLYLLGKVDRDVVVRFNIGELVPVLLRDYLNNSSEEPLNVMLRRYQGKKGPFLLGRLNGFPVPGLYSENNKNRLNRNRLLFEWQPSQGIPGDNG